MTRALPWTPDQDARLTALLRQHGAMLKDSPAAWSQPKLCAETCKAAEYAKCSIGLHPRSRGCRRGSVAGWLADHLNRYFLSEPASFFVGAFDAHVDVEKGCLLIVEDELPPSRKFGSVEFKR